MMDVLLFWLINGYARLSCAYGVIYSVSVPSS